MRKYLVVYERAKDGGWGAYLPDLAGVVALGASRGETRLPQLAGTRGRS